MYSYFYINYFFIIYLEYFYLLFNQFNFLTYYYPFNRYLFNNFNQWKHSLMFQYMVYQVLFHLISILFDIPNHLTHFYNSILSLKMYKLKWWNLLLAILMHFIKMLRSNFYNRCIMHQRNLNYMTNYLTNSEYFMLMKIEEVLFEYLHMENMAD
jgi:hypothetical protein